MHEEKSTRAVAAAQEWEVSRNGNPCGEKDLLPASRGPGARSAVTQAC